MGKLEGGDDSGDELDAKDVSVVGDGELDEVGDGPLVELFDGASKRSMMREKGCKRPHGPERLESETAPASVIAEKVFPVLRVMLVSSEIIEQTRW